MQTKLCLVIYHELRTAVQVIGSNIMCLSHTVDCSALCLQWPLASVLLPSCCPTRIKIQPGMEILPLKLSKSINYWTSNMSNLTGNKSGIILCRPSDIVRWHGRNQNASIAKLKTRQTALFSLRLKSCSLLDHKLKNFINPGLPNQALRNPAPVIGVLDIWQWNNCNAFCKGRSTITNILYLFSS